MTCEWCGAAVIEADVLVGPPGDQRSVSMTLDAEERTGPSLPGQSVVIRRRDGCLRLLMPQTRRPEGKPYLRIHGATQCVPVEPIRVPCEGSGCRVHFPHLNGGMCSMCGVRVTCDDAGIARPHDRNDVLAMLARGDFG